MERCNEALSHSTVHYHFFIKNLTVFSLNKFCRLDTANSKLTYILTFSWAFPLHWGTFTEILFSLSFGLIERGCLQNSLSDLHIIFLLVVLKNFFWICREELLVIGVLNILMKSVVINKSIIKAYIWIYVVIIWLSLNILFS